MGQLSFSFRTLLAKDDGALAAPLSLGVTMGPESVMLANGAAIADFDMLHPCAAQDQSVHFF